METSESNEFDSFFVSSRAIGSLMYISRDLDASFFKNATHVYFQVKMDFGVARMVLTPSTDKGCLLTSLGATKGRYFSIGKYFKVLGILPEDNRYYVEKINEDGTIVFEPFRRELEVIYTGS